METKQVDLLTSVSVSILTVADGKNHRKSYYNSECGRKELLDNEPKDVVDIVMSIWGDEPTVEAPQESDLPQEPTTDERLSALEEQNNTLIECLLEISEIIYAG